MNKKQYILSLILVLFIAMVIVSGGTFAYMRWVSSTNQQTALNINVTEKINMRIDNPMDSKFGMYPTVNCGGEAGMSFVSIISIENQTGVLAAPNFKLKVKITDSSGNVITNEKSTMDLQNGGNNPFRYYINYAVSEENGDCTQPLYTGRFDVNQATASGSTEWYDSELITLSDESGFPIPSMSTNAGVSFNAVPYETTTHNYKVWAWVDSTYTTVVSGNSTSIDKLQNATISVSFSQNSTVEQKRNDLIAYAVYSSQDNSLRFYDTSEVIKEGMTYNNLPATNVYKIYEDDNYVYNSETERTTSPWDSIRENITKVVVEDEISPRSTANWFNHFTKTSSIDVTKLDTSNIMDMTRMFIRTGMDSSVTTFTITGLNNWDTSNVTSMGSMFYQAGKSAATFDIGNLSNWDTQNVTNMYAMFTQTGRSATTFNIGNLSNWDVSNVTDMSYMFREIGYSDTTFNIGNLSNWDVSKVTNMLQMFYETGYNATNWSLDLSEWDVSNVTNMKFLFCRTGYSATAWSVGDLSEWNVSKVTDMSSAFESAGYGVTTFNIGNLSNWNVSNVTDMSYMFSFAGHSATTFNIGDLSNWNVSNVTNMFQMFADAGYSATTFNIGDLSNWDVSKVTNMKRMFSLAGRSATAWSVGDLSEWNVSNVINMNTMFGNAGYSATTFNIGDLSNWNVSNVTDMTYMFYYAGYSATTFNIGNLSNWNVSNVTDMKQMFYRAGYNATNWSLDLSSWNVDKVTDHTDFNEGASTKITPPTWVN